MRSSLDPNAPEFIRRKSTSTNVRDPTANATLREGHPHCWTVDQVVEQLNTSLEHGLSRTEAEDRLQTYGRNELEGGGGVNPVRILIKQIANAMVLVLMAAMAVSFGIGSYIEGGVVTAVIAVNVITGFVQEYGAEKTMVSITPLISIFFFFT